MKCKIRLKLSQLRLGLGLSELDNRYVKTKLAGAYTFRDLIEQCLIPEEQTNRVKLEILIELYMLTKCNTVLASLGVVKSRNSM